MTGPLATAAGVSIRALGGAEAEARLGELSAILVDAVAHGASVNFLAGFSDEESRAFWRSQLPGWTEVGTVADHSFTADGRLAAATVFCKALGPHRRPDAAR